MIETQAIRPCERYSDSPLNSVLLAQLFKYFNLLFNLQKNSGVRYNINIPLGLKNL